MVGERDVEVGLDSRVLQAVPFYEPEERLVAGVLREGISEGVIRGQVDAESPEPLEKLGVIGLADERRVDRSGIGAPFEK